MEKGALSNANKSNGGRPSVYTPLLAAAICERLMQGESLRSICLDEDMPDKATVCRWLANPKKHAKFCDQYARAREIQAEMMADDIIDIADEVQYDTTTNDNGDKTPDREWIMRSKLRVEARQWVASKLLPKKYGTHKAVEVKHSGELEIKPITGMVIK